MAFEPLSNIAILMKANEAKNKLPRDIVVYAVLKARLDQKLLRMI